MGQARPSRRARHADRPALARAGAAIDAAADAEMGWLVKLISDIRSARAELNVPAGAKLKLLVVGADDTTKKRLETHRAAIERLARIEGIEAAPAAPKARAADRGRRGDLCLAGRRRHRPQGRERAAAEGNQEAGRRGRQDRRQARQRRLRVARAGRGRRGAARAPQPGRADPRPAQHGAGTPERIDRALHSRCCRSSSSAT